MSEHNEVEPYSASEILTNYNKPNLLMAHTERLIRSDKYKRWQHLCVLAVFVGTVVIRLVLYEVRIINALSI